MNGVGPRYRGEFREPTETRTDTGRTEAGFAPRFTRWCGVRFLKGTEAVQAARMTGQQPVILTVYRDSDTRRVTSDWVVVINGASYNISEPPRASDDMLHLEMMAVSGVSE